MPTEERIQKRKAEMERYRRMKEADDELLGMEEALNQSLKLKSV